MRLDKYLKVSRIIKRRTVANEACDSIRNKSRQGPCDERAGDDPQGRYEGNV